MGILKDCRLLWILGASLLICPHLNLGLLSDLKICGDPECESLMSRVQAIKDHHGKDCRFLSFKRGETIFVYHKLAGKRTDLWAGSIDKHFGYFPKDAVQEEQVYAAAEKVVETQKSDFFCLDEFGYPIDSTNLDSDDDSDNDSDAKIHIQESETNQMTRSTHTIDTDGPVISAQLSTESFIKAAKAEGDENKRSDDTNGPQEEAHGSPATLNEQGGSPSSSWLGSSPLGWLGLAKEEQPGHLAEGEREDKRIETESETSLTSSVTGWLGFGEKGKPETIQEGLKIKETMTGWLGFGSEKEINPPSNEQDEGETDEEKEPTEKFRSRRMSLDLEGSKLHKEENNEMGTLGWLGNGLSSRLGFGLTNQDPENQPSKEDLETEKQQLVSSSWMDMGIGSILGFRGDDIKADGSKEEDTTSDQPADLQSEDASRSLVPPTDEIKMEASNEPEEKEPINKLIVAVTEAVSPDSNDNGINGVKETAERMESSDLGDEDGPKVGHKDISDHLEFKEKSQDGSGNMISSFFQVSDKQDEKDHQIANSKSADNTREPLDIELNNSRDHQDFIPQSEISLDQHSLDVLKPHFTVQSVVKDATDGHDHEEEVKIPNWDDNLVKSTDIPIHQGSTEQTDLSPSKASQTLTEESVEESKVYRDAEETSQQSQLYSSSDKESNEPIPTENSFTPTLAELHDGNSTTPIKNGKNAETHRSELAEDVGNQTTEKSSEERVEQRGTISPSGKTTNKSNVGVSSHIEYNEQGVSDAENVVETMKPQHKETETFKFEEEKSESTQAQTGKVEDLMLENETTKGSEKVDDLKDEEKQKEVQEEVNGEKQLDKMEEIKENETQEENWALEEERDVENTKKEITEEDEKGVAGLNDEEVNKIKKQQKVEELKEIQEQEKKVRVDVSKEDEDTSEKETKEKAKETNENTIPEDYSMGSFRETATQTERTQVEEEMGEETTAEEVGKEEEVQMKHVEEGVKVMEGDGNSSEGDEGTTWTQDQNDQTHQTGESQEIDSDENHVVIKRNDDSGEQVRETETGRSESHSDGGGLSLTADGFESSFTHTATQTQSPQAEEEREHQTEEEEGEDETIEEQESVTDGEGTDGRANSAGEETTWTGEKLDHAEHSGERQILDSDGSTSSETEVQMRKTDSETFAGKSHLDGGELSAQAVTSGHTPTQSTHLAGAPEPEGAGAFSVFKNALGFLHQTPTTDSEQLAQGLDADPGETSQLSPEQDLESSTDSHQVEDRGPTEQPQPVDEASAEHIPRTEPTVTPPHLQIHANTKRYRNLLSLMTVDETAVLLELFGRHKLQFLDDILASSEENRDDDQSIMSDIEALLHRHIATLTAATMRLTDAPQEDKEKTKKLIALQKLESLLKTMKETFNTGMSQVSNHQAEPSCVSSSCLTQDKHKEDPALSKDTNIYTNEHMTGEKDQVGGTFKEGNSVDEARSDKRREEERASFPFTQPGSLQSQEGVMKQILDFTHQMVDYFTNHSHAVKGLLVWLTVKVVSSLPDDIRPGPDLYGVPWEPVIIASLLGLLTVMLFTCRCYSSIKSRMYQSKERWMAEQVAQLLDEKCKVLETLSQCQQEYDDLESSLKDSGVLAQTQKTEYLEIKARQSEQAKTELGRDLEQLKDQLDQQSEHRQEQERRIAVLEESMKALEEETKDLQSQEEQAQTTLKIYNMNSDRLQRNLETAGEENTVLQESNAHLKQQVEGWAERVGEVEAEMQRCEAAHSGMLQDVANKDERIMSLTDRLLRIKAWDSDLEEEENDGSGEREGTNGTAVKAEGDGNLTDAHLQKVQKLIYAAKLNADLKAVDEDKDRVFAKLNDEVSAKEDLQVGIKEMEKEQLSLQANTELYSDQVQRLQQKLQIMTEMYQENELKLHRMLTVEEKERLQKEEKLHKADKNIAMAMEELNNYRQRAEEMEEELEKTRQSYQTQISAHEKKAHNNWLAARAAERDLSDIRRENGLLRQKLTETQLKLDSLDKDPFALNSLARPLPFRAERSSYGPSPLGRPSPETRAFLSPPTLMDGPPARLSPRVLRGPGEPPGGQGEMERSGGPHSDSGSISPTWERDRRGPPPGPPGPPGLPGHMFPEPGGPMFRRPPPGPLCPLPPPGSLPPGPLHPRGLPPGLPHPLEMADGSFRNSLGPGDQEPRVSGPGDQRISPESDPRMGAPPPPGPPMGPTDGPFPRRSPYGPPPPPDFYHPRGPGGPPMMPMWAPPQTGMMFPPRFPPGGPPLPPAPHPNMTSYGPPMGLPPHDGLPPSSMGPPPPQQSFPSHPPEQTTPSPEDAI